MKTSTLVALRLLAAMAALFALGGVLWTLVAWRSANEALVQQAYYDVSEVSAFLVYELVAVTLVNGLFLCALGVSAYRLFKKDEGGVDSFYGVLKVELIYLCVMMMGWAITGRMIAETESHSLATAILLPQLVLGFPITGLVAFWFLERNKVLRGSTRPVLKSAWLSAWTLLAVTTAVVCTGSAVRRRFYHDIFFSRVHGPSLVTVAGHVNLNAFRRCTFDHDSMMLFGTVNRNDSAFGVDYYHSKAMTGKPRDAAKALILLAIHFYRVTEIIETGWPNNILCAVPQRGLSLLMVPLGLPELSTCFDSVTPYVVPQSGRSGTEPLKPMTMENLQEQFEDHMRTCLPHLMPAADRIDPVELERRAEKVFAACGSVYAPHRAFFSKMLERFRAAVDRYGKPDAPDYPFIFAAQFELLAKAQEMGVDIAAMSLQEREVYDIRHKAIRATLMDGRDLLIAWPGMGEGTEAGTRELIARLESVREALVPGQDTSWSILDAKSLEVARLGTDKHSQHIRIPSDLRLQPTNADKN